MPRRKPIELKGSDGKPFTITVNEFKSGVMSLLDESRLPVTAVNQAQNMMLDQDGVWRPRYGSQTYGAVLTGPIDGFSNTIVVYNSDGTNTNYLFVMDNGSVKYSKDGGAWTTLLASGGGAKTYAVGYAVTFTQIRSRVYITNGKDTLTYVDLNAFNIITYTALATPSAPTLTKTGLSGSTYNLYYKITAVTNNIGETAASISSTVQTVGKPRGLSGTVANWTLGTDFVSLSWGAITGTDSYNIYVSDRNTAGVDYYFIDSVTTNSYVDNGQLLANSYQVAPAFDGTSGPPMNIIRNTGNRLMGTGDNTNPYRIYGTGTGTYLGSFNPFFGGFWIDLELGGAERPVDIQHFRDGKGTATATVLTANPNGGGSTWFITLTSVTVNNIPVTIPQVTKQGSIGTNSPRGVVQASNNVYYPSAKGFQSLGSATSILNVLVTNEVSANIRPSVQGINNAYANLITGIFFLGRIFWSVPFGSTTNNQIWVLDLERQAWCLPWSIGVKQFAEYTDSGGTIHLLAIPTTGTKLIEFSATIQGDSGVAFTTLLESGLISWDKDHTLWARLDKAYIELGRPKGNISFQITGSQKNKPLALLQSIKITDTLSNSGLGSDMFGDFLFGDSNNAPSTFATSSVKKRLRIRKRLNNAKWSVTSSDINQQYSVLEAVLKGKIIPTSDPTNWKN
jgi:hypothetical protein